MSRPAVRPEGAIPVLSLCQPHASLVAMLVKWLETRSWSTTYRGRLAIASTRRIPREYDPPLNQGEGWTDPIGTWRVLHEKRVLRGRTLSSTYSLLASGERRRHPMPLGCILATVDLVDVLPMLAHSVPSPSNAAHLLVGTRHDPDRLLVARPATGYHSSNDGSGGVSTHFEWDTQVVTDQRPYGLFAPGRRAWVFADVRPLAEPVPFSGGRMLTKFWVPPAEAA